MSSASFLSPKRSIQKDLNFVNSINIAIVEFPITNFLRFIEKNPRNTYHREKYMSFFLNLLELEPLKIKINDNKFVAFTFCHWVGLEKRKNTWFVELRIAANILSITSCIRFLEYSQVSQTLPAIAFE